MKTIRQLLTTASLVALANGCSPEPSAPASAPAGPGQAAPAGDALHRTPESAQAAPAEAQPRRSAAPRRPLSEQDIDSVRSRDPFQPPLADSPGPPRDDRPRKSARYAIAELKLVAVVRHAAAPRAMVVDPSGRGWVIGHGELLGRPEPVHGGAGDRLASWRVDRIRERDVVLVRDDPGDPEAAGATRVLALPADPVELAEGDEFAMR